MAMMFIATIFLLTSFTGFVSTFEYRGWNEAFLGVSSGIIDGAVVNYSPDQANPHPYFEKRLLTVILDEYVAINFAPYSKKTTYTVTLRDPIYSIDYQTVEISFFGELSHREVTREAVFHIVEVSHEQ